MSDQTRPSSPDSYNGFFHHKSWSEPWSSSDFSPDQGQVKFYNRLENQPWWGKSLSGRWPWGYFIYWTTYGSDEDWNQALAKLHRYIHCTIRYDDNPEPAEIVWEGCKNVIVDDRELLEGASPVKIILIHRNFPDKGYRHEPYNVSWVRLTIGGIWPFSYSFDTVEFGEQDPGIGRPGLIPYYDGYWTWVEDVNGQKVTDDDDDLESGYGVHDSYEYLREGGYI
ncbi:hypothetical protein BDV27DRAFT_150775 [Aspergillus caelatus]|uniref:Uncharacterized protein n=1 Tax=Aspergillus caelatus TaxID=61420 RepID=A0A5N6ZMK4_9EURO|nr:uncharacterized protein BDV27DRAFT_150775 [Aspergillus caelatus]KAE8358059.1 hypothetical protein BDV27DRAFT_150775 [Aspergillus caelatus]